MTSEITAATTRRAIDIQSSINAAGSPAPRLGPDHFDLALVAARVVSST
jgi:hypothetical protein